MNTSYAKLFVRRARLAHDSKGWKLVSRKDPKKVLKRWDHKPSKKEVSKREAEIEMFKSMSKRKKALFESKLIKVARYDVRVSLESIPRFLMIQDKGKERYEDPSNFWLGVIKDIVDRGVKTWSDFSAAFGSKAPDLLSAISKQPTSELFGNVLKELEKHGVDFDNLPRTLETIEPKVRKAVEDFVANELKRQEEEKHKEHAGEITPYEKGEVVKVESPKNLTQEVK